MSAERKHGARKAVRTGHSRQGPPLSALRERIGEELSGAQHVISALSRDLERYRRENRNLTHDRNRLRDKLAHLDMARLEQADTEALWRTASRERQTAESRLEALEMQNRELSERCAALGEQVAEHGGDDEMAEAEIACLEEQIAELEAIVALLAAEPSDAASE